MWEDRHSGLRKHKLMTKKLAKKLPAIYAHEDVEDYDDVVAQVKLFSPWSGFRWYVTEWDEETGQCYGLVTGFETELGYFDLQELSDAKVMGTVPAVERDLYWTPITLREIRALPESRPLG